MASPPRPEVHRLSQVPDPVDSGLYEEPDPWAAAATAIRPPTPAGSQSGAREKKYVDYKVDPAPSWGGDMPEKNYKEYIRNLQLWLVEAEARLPHNLIGKRIIDSIPLGSKLSSLLAHLTVDDICSDNGHKVILGIIEDAHEYLKDLRLETAFDDAIFKGRRERGQTLTSFLTTKKAAFADLKKQGLDLLATSPGRHLLGHLILRQGSFTQDQRQRLKVVTNGSIDYKDIEMAIQKVFGDKLDESHGHHEAVGTPRRWRSATYWDEEMNEEMFDDEPTATYGEIEDDDPFEDLIALNDDGSEAQFIFLHEMPVIMDETEAIEMVSDNLEEIFYETHQRLHSKGKGKGKKGKGKGKGGSSRTYGLGAPGFGRGGGYLEHRRLLQAARTGRGFDRPWQTRQGTSKMSLNDIKAKSRCHQCKQIGHWSRECPQRNKQASTAPSSRSSHVSGGSTMSTGFFTSPPAVMANCGHKFLTTNLDPISCEYMFSGLSFVFLGSAPDRGMALVDTAAQHGLVGHDTLQRHDRHLREHFGLQVQWSNEHGGSVRGVCGQEESTRIAYIPIGLSGKSGVLRVQVVPGEIPFLLPAYFLTDLKAVIDMHHLTIIYMSLAVQQRMYRMSTGHVAVCITEFGHGFQVPSDFAGTKSQAWSLEPLPDQARPSTSTTSHGGMAGSLAALAAALAGVCGLAGAPMPDGGGSNAPTTWSPSPSTTARGLGEEGFGLGSGRTEDVGRSCICQHCPAWNNPDLVQAGGSCPTPIVHHGERQIFGAMLGRQRSLPAFEDSAWRQQEHELPEVSQLRPRAADALDTGQPDGDLEQHPRVCQPRLLPEEEGQGGEGRVRQGRVHSIFNSGLPEARSQVERKGNGCQDNAAEEKPHSGVLFRSGGTGGGSADGRRVGGDQPHWTSGHCDVFDGERCPGSALRNLQQWEPPTSSTPDDWATTVEMHEPHLPTGLESSSRTHQTGSGDIPLPTVQLRRDDDCTSDGWRCSAHGADLPEHQLQSGHLPLPAPRLLPPDGPVRDREHQQVSCWWLQSPPDKIEIDETYGGLLDTLNLNPSTTFVAIGYGDVVKGKSPVVTNTFVSRRVILTHDGDDGLWCAVDMTTTPGHDYVLGAPMDYVVFYEFDPEFIDYLVESEYENEVTLSRSDKMSINGSLDMLLGDLTTYWALWEEEDAQDDVAEVFGSIWETRDTVVEVYSPPRVVRRAAARGLRAELSVDLTTGVDLSDRQQKAQVRQDLQQRKPRLLITSPPCTKFSPLQNLRWYPELLQQELGPAIDHMDYSMDLQEDQLQRGGYGLHEHPDTSTSWSLPRVQQFLQHDEVILVKAHLCRFGLRVRQKLNRKSTLFATTCDSIAVNLQKQCKCLEGHEPLIGGLPQAAQEYPPKLVDAIIDGLILDWAQRQRGLPDHLPTRGDFEQWCDSMHHREMFHWHKFHDSAVLILRKPDSVPRSGPARRILRWTWAKGVLDGRWIQLERGQQGATPRFEVKYPFVVVLYYFPAINQVLATEEGKNASISTQEKSMVLRAHVNLGHPQMKEFVRLLRAAGTRPDIIDYVMKEFVCEGCLKERRQPSRLPAATPRTYDFNVVIGVDLLFVMGCKPTDEHPILNVTCLGTLYSTFTMVDATRRSSAMVWSSFLRSWVRTFGAPSFLLYDQGLEFQGAFVEGLEELGIQPIVIDRDSPYQNGTVERRGGLFKEVYYKTRELRQPADLQEVQDMVHEVAWALQTMTNRSGFSPAQRVFGRQPSIAMELLNDAGTFEQTQSPTADAAWLRADEIRQAARKALMEVDGRERLNRAVRARPRRQREEHEFKEGDPVYVWRQGKRGAQAKVGPCFVVLQKGSTVWVTRRGELWRCNKTQVFKMGNLEAQGLEVIPAELLRAKERLRFHPEKLGFIDVEQEGDPPDTAFRDEQPAPTAGNIQRKAPGTPRAPATPRAPQTPVLQGPPEGLKQVQSSQARSAPSTPAIMREAPKTPPPARAQTPDTTPAKGSTATLARSRSPAPRPQPPPKTVTISADDEPHPAQEPPHASQESSTQQATPAAAAPAAAVVPQGMREGDELWKATVENQLSRSSASTGPTAPPTHEQLKAWTRYDFEAKRYRGSNSRGPLWSDVVRRLTLDLDANKIIQDLTITENLSVHKLHEKLPTGVKNIETTLIYRPDLEIQIQANRMKHFFLNRLNSQPRKHESKSHKKMPDSPTSDWPGAHVLYLQMDELPTGARPSASGGLMMSLSGVIREDFQ